MDKKIRVTILDDHPSVIDGYISRLKEHPQIEIAAAVSFGEELEPALTQHPSDVLLLDINVPTSSENPSPYPILHAIPKLLQTFENLNILVVSMIAERGMVRAVMEAGASGYILKDDPAAYRELGSVVKSIAAEGRYFSRAAHDLYHKIVSSETNAAKLSRRQLEALSLRLAYPQKTNADVATMMKISHSTVRNLLSNAYEKLDVQNLNAALAKAREMGLLTPNPPEHREE